MNTNFLETSSKHNYLFETAQLFVIVNWILKYQQISDEFLRLLHSQNITGLRIKH